MDDGYLFEEVKLKKTVSQLFQINTEANITQGKLNVVLTSHGSLNVG